MVKRAKLLGCSFVAFCMTFIAHAGDTVNTTIDVTKGGLSLAALAFLIIIVLFIWIYRLNKQIRSKTVELQKARSNLEVMVQKHSHISIKTEETLLHEQDRHRVIIEHAHMGIVTYQFGKPLLSANNTFCQIMGYTVNDLMSMTLEDLIHPDERGDTEQVTHQKRFVRKDGSIIKLKVVKVSTYDAAGNIDLTIVQVEDITPQLLAEAEVLNQHEQLAHLDSINRFGEMASGIAHEINQPLTAISLFAQAGKRLVEAGNQERIPGVFDKLSEQAQRAGAIIERVQMMTHQRKSIRDISDCNKLMMELAKLAEAQARIRDIEVVVEIDNRLPLVAVDTLQIQQVALILLSNGMEAMQSINCRNGNKITLKTALRQDGSAEVAVIDSGNGVTEDYKDKLFTPFLTTKESGMGMGLSISRAIVFAHGGILDFQNNATSGATFFFSLPAATQSQQDE